MTATEATTDQTGGGAHLPADDVVAHGVAILQSLGVPADDARLVSRIPGHLGYVGTPLARHAAPGAGTSPGCGQG